MWCLITSAITFMLGGLTIVFMWHTIDVNNKTLIDMEKHEQEITKALSTLDKYLRRIEND